MEESKGSKTKKKMDWKLWFALAVVVVSLGVAAYFWNDAREAKQQTPDAIAARNQEETQNVVASLTSVLFIEGDDEPTVARVEDPSILQDSNPDFYKNVEIGDYLVLYPQRAIIYRLAEKKIVNIAPIINTSDLQQDQQQQQAEPAEEEAQEDTEN